MFDVECSMFNLPAPPRKKFFRTLEKSRHADYRGISGGVLRLYRGLHLRWLHGGKENPEDAAASQGILHRDDAIMRPHDAQGHRQAEPSPGGLGGKERIE